MIRWQHQTQGVKDVIDALMNGEKRVCLTSPTGGGKMLMICDLITDFLSRGLKTVLYTNRRMLREQLSRTLRTQGIEHGVRAAGHEREDGYDVQVSSLPTEHARVTKGGTWGLYDADVAIVDECFTADTVILTPRGEIRIDNVRPGDTVYCGTGVGVVEAVSCRPSDDLYHLEFDDGRHCTCTPNHPFFTDRGWTPARLMVRGAITYGPEDVCRLWQSVPAEQVDVQGKGNGGGRSPLAGSDELLAILLQEGEEPDEQQRERSQDARATQGDPAQATEAGRQRAIAALGSIGASSRARGRLGVGVPCADRQEERGRLPHALQGRRGQSAEQDGLRGGRGVPHDYQQKTARREKNDLPRGTRLVRVSRQQSTSPVAVFNLRVRGHPSYFANGRLVHNCHLNTGQTARTILDAHLAEGAAIVGVTATPLDIAGVYECLIQAGVNSDLRACGALVPLIHYACDEPDMRELKRLKALQAGEDPSQNAVRKVMVTPTLWGRVFEWFEKLNPAHKPTLLFAPGVEESLHFAKYFSGRGVPAAHIDGETVWVGDKFYRSNREARDDVLAKSRSGEVKVVCNRFVLREGIDMPWVEHGIFATVMGSPTTYRQAGGRLLRASPKTGKTIATLQDHGGHAWRAGLGSLNADHYYQLGDTASAVCALAEERLRSKKCRKCGAVLSGPRCVSCLADNEWEPRWCPQCARVLNGVSCPCGYVIPAGKRTRPVVQLDGTLVAVDGAVFKPRRISKRPDGPKRWEQMYFRSRTEKGKRTFRAAFALFAQENNWGYPAPAWPYMPRFDEDAVRMVEDVPLSRLVGYCEGCNRCRCACGEPATKGV